MSSGTRNVYPRKLNKGFNSEFLAGHPDRDTAEEVRWAKRSK